MRKENYSYAIWPLIISGIMLFLADSTFQYDYYVVMRWLVSASGVAAAYVLFSRKKMILALLVSAVVVLFNPIIPVHMTKESWRLPDFFASIFYFYLAYYVYRLQVAEDFERK